MDFDTYIGKEKQLLTRLERERAAINSYEKKGNEGNLDLAEDEIKLLRMSLLMKTRTDSAMDASRELDEKIVRIKEAEDKAEMKNAEMVLKISEWETAFDSKYKQLLSRMDKEMSTMETRNKEFMEFSRKQEELFKARNDQLIARIDEAEKSLKKANEKTYSEISQLVASLKEAQKDFETSVNEKLEQDKQTIDKIKYMLSTMSDIIKM
jgi:hypothetical protein